jgi:ATP-dependent Clp protease adaptor protein ClpS
VSSNPHNNISKQPSSSERKYSEQMVDDDHNDPNRRDEQDNPDTGLMLKVRPKTRKPSMYKVMLLNDDFTPMDFVVHILEKFFNKTRQEASDIMMQVHRRGVGVCGIYTFEIAETKVTQVMDFARTHEQPLQCTMEKE